MSDNGIWRKIGDFIFDNPMIDYRIIWHCQPNGIFRHKQAEGVQIIGPRSINVCVYCHAFQVWRPTISYTMSREQFQSEEWQNWLKDYRFLTMDGEPLTKFNAVDEKNHFKIVCPDCVSLGLTGEEFKLIKFPTSLKPMVDRNGEAYLDYYYLSKDKGELESIPTE